MAVPEVIPIRSEPDYRTDTIGRYAHGQFVASTTWAFREGVGGHEEHEWAALAPDDLLFTGPWDGSYDT